jgi:2-C-methyl-D-erythritol 4-phosphate cytidylyltransferase
MVCIHDAARPFVSVQLIEKAIRECKKYDGVVVALPSNDTVKEIIGKNNQIKRTIPRDTIWLAQTPQVFNRRKLIDALSYAKDNGITVTDESTLLETLKHEIVVVEGNTNNFKITTREDWNFAELILEKAND